MQSFIALYRGEPVTSSRLVALSTDPDLVAQFAQALLDRKEETAGDPVESAVLTGRRRALRLIRVEAEKSPDENG